jgi:ribosome assembly protein 1
MTNEDIEVKREAIRQIKLQQSEAAAAAAITAANTPDQAAGPQKGSPIRVEEPQVKNDNNNNIEEEQKYEFLAFARVFSGTLKRGQTLYILAPRHNPEDFIGKV